MPTIECNGIKIQVCERCLMLSTRPRLTFNSAGVCAACQWAEEKKTVVDWKKRKEELNSYCDKYRNNDCFDVIVPVSGGKDSSTVAHKLKTEYGMTPLCVNISQSIDANTEINDINLNNFIKNGFNTIRLYPNPTIDRELDRIGFIDYGRPFFGWQISVAMAPLKLAIKFGIPFIMYGEEGEVEYGGSTKLKNVSIYSIENVIELYLSGAHPNTFLKYYTDKDLYWYLPPTKDEISKFEPALAHWSYFENWNSRYNYKYAQKHAGLKETKNNASGTYNNFSQTDSILYPLHTYFMYLKFGFGRCSQDVCIDIRNDEITREDGLKLINEYDETYPVEFEEQYLDYYGLTKDEFYAVIDKFANKDLLEKRGGVWRKKFKLL